MKLGRRFKLVLLSTGIALYATGIAVWVLARHFQVDRGFGPEPARSRFWLLRAHSVAGLVSLAVFGYLIRAHVEPSLPKRRRRRSGLLMLGALVLLFATVPLLFYLSNDAARGAAARLHAWLGAALLLPYLIHRRPAEPSHR